jgi:hypothetical protein
LFLNPARAGCGSIDELVDEFNLKVESLKPLPNSSLNADYKQAQATLGTIYIIRTLKLLYEQNRELINQNDAIKSKYDALIEQNEEVIKLLSIIIQKETKTNRLLSISIKDKLPSAE